ncbi:MAG: zf-TFIIB domain-containing protein [Deltaproteobacteria bacterium]|nr:zf-TFIIB domain-containing protein [Deltaproteobacteria bacterium]
MVSDIPHENEYFTRIEREKREKLKAAQQQTQQEAERQAAKDLHYHRCGKCGAPMDTRVFREVEIEVCPDCGAVLLDPGELEQLAGPEREGVLSGVFALFKAKG